MWNAAPTSARVRRAALGAAVTLATTALAGLSNAASASPGDLDPGFGGANHGRVAFALGTVTDLAVQPNGKVVVVGFSPDLHAVMTRFNADGTPDRDFGTVTLTAGTQTEQARAVVVQPDGRIVVAGSVIDAAGQDDVGVWRVLPSGKPDTTFGGGDGYLQVGDAGVLEFPSDIALDHRGRIVVAGVGQGAGFDVLALRVTASGLPDPTFNHGSTSFDVNHFGTDVGVAVAVQKDNQIVVAANYAGARGYAALRIAPGDATPSGFAGLDQTFGDGGVADVAGTLPANLNTDVAVTRDGHILLLDGLPSISTPGGADATVVRLDSSGNVDPTFGSATGARLPVPQGAASIVGKGIALLPHGDIAVAGDSGTGSNGFVAEVSRTGAPDTGMGPHGVKPLRALDGMVGAASLADGRILAAGNVVGRENVLYRLRGDLVAPSCGRRQATIVGTSAADRLVGTKHADVIAGLGGGDTVTGLGKGDVICGGSGKDHLSGGAGADHLYGGRGLDVLRGGPGRDVIRQ